MAKKKSKATKRSASRKPSAAAAKPKKVSWIAKGYPVLSPMTALSPIATMDAAEATLALRRIIKEKFAQQPPLSALLKEWQPKLKADGDALALASHFRRLALASAMLDGMRKATAKLPGPKERSK